MNKYCLSTEPRQFHYLDQDVKKSVWLRQLIVLRDFNGIVAGSTGGWIDDESVLSQQGNCWIHDENSLAFAGVQIRDDAQITGPCLLFDGVQVSGQVCIEQSTLSHQVRISDQVRVQHSIVRGECHLFGGARIVDGSEILALQGMTEDQTTLLQIYEQATVSRSRVVHQAQIYGNAIIHYAFVEHRAEVFDDAQLQGNDENNVWVCDCAKVYGQARVVAGTGEDEIPTLRYSSQVAENALIEGNCLLRHHVQVGGHARLSGGPIMLDDHVQIYGYARISGEVLIEHHVELNDHAVVESFNGASIHLRGRKIISGEERITRTPLLGSL